MKPVLSFTLNKAASIRGEGAATVLSQNSARESESSQIIGFYVTGKTFGKRGSTEGVVGIENE